MKPPTQAFLRAVCRRLDLDPGEVTRLSLMPDRVTVDHLTLTAEDRPVQWTETMDVIR